MTREGLFLILYEDDTILALHKPAGLVCHPTKADERSSLIGRLRLYFGAAHDIHIITRLDRETSGLVLIAKSLNTARELRSQWENQEVEKEYMALVHGIAEPQSGWINAPLGKDVESPVAVRDCVRSDGALAHTHYETIASFQRNEMIFSLLKIRPKTGRKHQIRIHLAHLGHPIVGDKLYGSDPNAYLDFAKHRISAKQQMELILPFQALHARSLRFRLGGHSFFLKCNPECWFRLFARGNPGESEVWEGF